MAALDRLTVLVPESRELDLFAAMLEEEGAGTLRCPLVRILPLDDSAGAEAWIARCIDGAFQDLILMTGEGVRHLSAIAGVKRLAFVAALGKVRKIVRGPKPSRALRELGLSPDVSAPEPTSDGVLAVFAPEEVSGRRIGIQLYPGDGAKMLVDALRRRGAVIDTVTPYRYASGADTAEVLRAIEALAQGRVGLVAFTATPQIERLFAVAREAGAEASLQSGLANTPIAAVGPVVQEALQRFGLTAALSPETNFHMKPLVRAIMAWREAGPRGEEA